MALVLAGLPDGVSGYVTRLSDCVLVGVGVDARVVATLLWPSLLQGGGDVCSIGDCQGNAGVPELVEVQAFKAVLLRDPIFRYTCVRGVMGSCGFRFAENSQGEMHVLACSA